MGFLDEIEPLKQAALKELNEAGDVASLEASKGAWIGPNGKVKKHWAKVPKAADNPAKVLEARINGTPIEALCGHVWVPARDPKQLPICQACKEVYDMYRVFNDGLRDSPSD